MCITMTKQQAHTTFFENHVYALVATFEELSDPFEEESSDLIALAAAVETVYNAKESGQEQLNKFTHQEMHQDQTTPIQCNKLPWVLHNDPQGIQRKAAVEVGCSTLLTAVFACLMWRIHSQEHLRNWHDSTSLPRRLQK